MLRLALLLGLLAAAARAQLTFERRTVPIAGPAIVVTTADFNADGRTDAAVVNITGAVSVYLGRGDGSFDAARSVSLPFVPVRMIATADLNRDGRVDLVVTNNLNHSVSVALGRGDGSFLPGVEFPCGRSPQGVAAADFTGDGRLDIAVANNTGLIPSQSGTTVSVLVGRGDGTFGTPVPSPVAGERPVFVEPGDFNGDGKADLVVVSAFTPMASILLSRGDGSFEPPQTPNVGPPLAARPAVADLNRDGKLDIAFSVGGAFTNYLGNGDGTFRTPPFGGPLDGMGLMTGDFNWDGVPDAVSFHPPFAAAIVMLGRGDGFFGQQQPFEIGPMATDFALGDFNNDGGLDFLATHQAISSFTLLLNTTRRPAVLANGVVNAASFLSGPLSVAPGEIVTIFGRNLGPSTMVTAKLRTPEYLDTLLEGTRVLFDGVEAPLIYTWSGQVSVVVPYGVSGKTTTELRVIYQSTSSPPLTLGVVPSVPGIFTATSSGTGMAAALNQNGTFNSAQNPAAKGSIITFFATGEGQTIPPGVDGRLATVPLPAPILPVVVGIANIGAEVLYAGAAPGLVSGLMQINARVPNDAPSGPRVPLIIRVGEALSQPGVTIAIE